MPPEGDPPTGEGQDPIDTAIADVDPTPDLSAVPAAVRNSPEYQALMRQNRTLARQNGTLTRANNAARTEAETARLAAEAQQQAVLDAEITAALGPEGVTFWTEFAELSATDPVAAAKRLAEFRTAGAAAQSAAAGTDPAAGDGAAGEGATVPAQTPPPPARGVDGGAPLGSAATGDDWQAEVAALETQYASIVKRNQDPVERNRVTMRDRAAGLIAYVGAAYVRAKNESARR